MDNVIEVHDITKVYTMGEVEVHAAVERRGVEWCDNPVLIVFENVLSLVEAHGAFSCGHRAGVDTAQDATDPAIRRR